MKGSETGQEDTCPRQPGGPKFQQPGLPGPPADNTLDPARRAHDHVSRAESPTQLSTGSTPLKTPARRPAPRCAGHESVGPLSLSVFPNKGLESSGFRRKSGRRKPPHTPAPNLTSPPVPGGGNGSQVSAKDLGRRPRKERQVTLRYF